MDPSFKPWLAKELNRLGAYKTGDFTLSSGKKSDTYLDCRLLTLSEVLPDVIAAMSDLLYDNRLMPTRIGGMSSGADPIIAGFLMNGEFQVRGFYTRKEPKPHGTLRLVEGHLSAEDKVVLVDDVATSGGSLLKSAKDVVQHGGRILCAMVIVDREEGAKEALWDEYRIPLYSLITLKEIKLHLNPIIVAASGGFDPLHDGHVEYLQRAKSYGDKLFVILNRDEFLIRKKGYAFMPWSKREAILRALRCVDEVVPSIDDDQSVCKTLEQLKPHIFAKGGDRNSGNIPEKEVCDRLGIEIVDGLGEKISSSSDLVNRMRKNA